MGTLEVLDVLDVLDVLSGVCDDDDVLLFVDVDDLLCVANEAMKKLNDGLKNAFGKMLFGKNDFWRLGEREEEKIGDHAPSFSAHLSLTHLSLTHLSLSQTTR